ncbi:hypothetical protein BGX38DRAFT_288569 [Terfezia claveryi]|nr:hypothetical protein BGX38DRAFT_288569 [Terfezia claveryi]
MELSEFTSEGVPTASGSLRKSIWAQASSSTEYRVPRPLHYRTNDEARAVAIPQQGTVELRLPKFGGQFPSAPHLHPLLFPTRALSKGGGSVVQLRVTLVRYCWLGSDTDGGTYPGDTVFYIHRSSVGYWHFAVHCRLSACW